MYHIGSKSPPHRYHGMDQIEKRDLGHSRLHGVVVIRVSINDWLGCMASHHRSFQILAPRHTQSLATMTTGAFGALSGIGLPWALNSDQGDFEAKVAFIYGSLLSLSCVGVFLYYPETKGGSFAEIDRLFETGVWPRDFLETHLESDQTDA